MRTALVGNVHLIAGSGATVPSLFKLLEKEGIHAQGNPDVFVRTYQQFGVDEARELRERASTRAIGGGQRVFIAVTPTLTSEAQNALLKTLEEPPAGALFFFIVPAPEMLLATLRSRAQTLELDAEAHEELVDAKKFLAAQPAKRLDLLKPLLDKGDDDPEKSRGPSFAKAMEGKHGAGKRDIGAILSFLSALERQLEKNPEGLESLYRARKYIGDRGALVKPLLEQIALLVPVK